MKWLSKDDQDFYLMRHWMSPMYTLWSDGLLILRFEPITEISVPPAFGPISGMTWLTIGRANRNICEFRDVMISFPLRTDTRTVCPPSDMDIWVVQTIRTPIDKGWYQAQTKIYTPDKTMSPAQLEKDLNALFQWCLLTWLAYNSILALFTSQKGSFVTHKNAS